MKLPGETLKEKAAHLSNSLPVGKKCKVVFSKHEDTAVLVSVKPATQKAIKDNGGNVPEKRADKTPETLTLTFNNGEDYRLHVVADDIDLELKINGAIIHLPSCTMSLMEMI